VSQKAGLWIDHSRAFVVSLEGEELTTGTVFSDLEKRVRAQGGSGSSTPYGPQDATYEARRDRRYEKHLAAYYDEVLSLISRAGSILVLGPGPAKSEFQKRLASSGLASVPVSLETVDKMTDAQIVERVKEHFGYPTRETF